MYGKLPEVLGMFKVDCKEYLSYQYLPIKLAYPDTSTLFYLHNITIERRLEPFRNLINFCCENYKSYITLQEWRKTYIYLTVKRCYQRNGKGFNREGFHSDGYLTEDINYIWSDSQPTIFNNSQFVLSEDDQLSLDQMYFQAKPENNITYPNNTLLKLDQYVRHRVGDILEGVRTFVKVSFSKDRYNLEGNSHNYELNYNWEMFPRRICRNIPQVKNVS
jgi:hypothetical protein